MSAGLDLLELELRRLPGVVFVGVVERADAVVVQILAETGADREEIQGRAGELARVYVDVPCAIDVLGESRPSRVRVTRIDLAADKVEVHLAFEGHEGVGVADSPSPDNVADATVTALEKLGARVPFRVQQTAVFRHEDTEGVMVVLGSPGTLGTLYGVAAAETMAQAAVRATLHALNRYLATTAFLMRQGDERHAPGR